MADTLRIKRRLAGGAAGAPASLAAAELAFNEQDNTLYYGKGNSGGNATSIIAIAGPGAFAPLASPVFTGDPQAPTPATGDNDTSIATTAFVKAQGYLTAGNYVLKAGDTMTGSLAINPGNLSIARASPSSGQVQINAYSGAIGASATRWVMIFCVNAETGSNAGSDFILQHYDDTGNLLAGNPISIVRSTGVVTIGNGLIAPTPATSDNSTNAATTAYVKANLGSYLPLAGGAMTGGINFGSVIATGVDLSKHLALWGTTYGLNVTSGQMNVVTNGVQVMSFLTSASIQANIQFNVQPASGNALFWVVAPSASLSIIRQASPAGIGSLLEVVGGSNYRWKWWWANGAEGGSNTGSDFLLQRFDDAGNGLTPNPLAVTRSSGLVTVGNGLSLGSQIASGSADLSKHLALYSSTYGFSITAATLNMVVNGGVPLTAGSGGVALAGAPTASTPSAGDDSTRIATTAFIAGMGSEQAGGRLTLTSNTPVLTANVTGATTIYYTPSVGNQLPLYDGTNFVAYGFAELSQALSDATKSPAAAVAEACYDIFGWIDGSTLRATRGPPWTVSNAAVGISIATPAVITWSAHPLKEGDPVIFTTTGALPTGITAGTIYYVGRSPAAGTFNIATSAANASAGTFVNTSGTQSGTHTATNRTRTRSTGAGTSELTRINGVLVNGNAITNGPAAGRGTYLGTIRTNASATIDFSFGGNQVAGAVNVWNYYNRVWHSAAVRDTGAGYPYNGSTMRQARASNAYQVNFVVGVQEDWLNATFHSEIVTAAVANAFGQIGIGVDRTTANDSPRFIAITFANATILQAGNVPYAFQPGIGSHFIAATELADGTNNATFNNNSSATLTLSCMA